jgi:hypothetical protein
MPAPAEVELEFGLRGGVPAVSPERLVTSPAPRILGCIRFNNARMRAASGGLLTIYNDALLNIMGNEVREFAELKIDPDRRVVFA